MNHHNLFSIILPRMIRLFAGKSWNNNTSNRARVLLAQPRCFHRIGGAGSVLDYNEDNSRKEIVAGSRKNYSGIGIIPLQNHNYQKIHRNTHGLNVVGGGMRNFSSQSGNNGTEVTYTDAGNSIGSEGSSQSIDDILDRLQADQQVPVEDGVVETAAVELSNYIPADLMVQALASLHDLAGPEIPYAFVIIGATISIRTVFPPLAISQQRNASRMAHMKPEMELMKERMERVQAQGNATPDMNVKMAQEMKDLFKKYDCNPLKSFLLPIVQFPTFMSMFFALRKMPEIYPASMANGGILWFPDLSVSDPYLILPFVSASSFLFMIEMTKSNMMASNPVQGKWRVDRINYIRLRTIM